MGRPPPLLPPTVHSDTKSNMADRINDRELITIARPDETLALQAINKIVILVFVTCLLDSALINPLTRQ